MIFPDFTVDLDDILIKGIFYFKKYIKNNNNESVRRVVNELKSHDLGLGDFSFKIYEIACIKKSNQCDIEFSITLEARLGENEFSMYLYKMRLTPDLEFKRDELLG